MPNIADARRTYANSLAFVASRYELPVILNERGLLGCGVEVGVKQGEFSAHILRGWAGCHLISVDPWAEDARDGYVGMANAEQHLEERYYQETIQALAPHAGRSSIWRTTSVEAARVIPHHALDFVYLDARHGLDSLIEDLEAWLDKLRPGGILSGYGYADGEIEPGVLGVRSAVDSFFAARGLMVYETMLDDQGTSWMVEIPIPAAKISLIPSEPAKPESTPTPAAAPRLLERSGRVRETSLRFSSASGPQEVRLQLDPKQMSQSMMLEYFDANMMYEPETSQLLATVLRPGDTFLDVGAHVGYFSMLAGALVGPAGRVVSFEPEERNFRQLVDHIEINQLSHVTPVNAAVAEAPGTAEFHVNSDNDGGHALWDVGLHHYNEQSREAPLTRQIDVVSLDRFLRENRISTPRMLKIDAEGAEHAVLLGAKETLRETPVAFVVAEINHFGLERMGTSERALRATMTELGYETYGFDPSGERIIRLGDDDYMQSDYVFNLVFRHPAAA